MRPIPAQRIGHTHGLLIALQQRGKLRLEDFLVDVPAEELFPPELENPSGRLRQLVSYARAAGLVREDRGAVELSDLGRSYVRAGDPGAVFAVSPIQAGWLRRELREKHLTDSIWTGAAIALSLHETLPEGERVEPVDVGRAVAHLGGAAWDDEQAFRSQGERLTNLLLDIELIAADGSLTPTGRETIAELRVPSHAGLLELLAELRPEAGAAEQADPPPDASFEAPEEVREPAPGEAIAGPEDPTRSYPRPGGAAEGTAGSSVAEDAASALVPIPSRPPAPPVAPPPPEPQAAGFQSGIRPSIVALRPEDLAHWKAAQEEKAKAEPEPPAGPFLDPEAVRSAAERRGLVIDAGVYAAAIAALATGRHLVLTGGAGSGKTSLALAIAEAAAGQGHCKSVLFTGAGGHLQSDLVPEAIEAERWLVIDELDRVPLDGALGAVSGLLGGETVQLPGGGEVSPPAGWRMIATMADIGQIATTTPALRRRFVFVEVPVLERADLESLVAEWAGDDEVAAAVGRRLAAIADVTPLGPALYRDAVEYVRSRRQLTEVDEDELTLEALAGFVLPQLEGEADELAARAVRAAGFDS